MDFSERLREMRLKRGMSQTDLAALIGVANTYVSGLERGQKGVGSEMLTKLSDALHTSIDYLMGRTDNPDPIEGKS